MLLLDSLFFALVAGAVLEHETKYNQVGRDEIKLTPDARQKTLRGPRRQRTVERSERGTIINKFVF